MITNAIKSFIRFVPIDQFNIVKVVPRWPIIVSFSYRTTLEPTPHPHLSEQTEPINLLRERDAGRQALQQYKRDFSKAV